MPVFVAVTRRSSCAMSSLVAVPCRHSSLCHAVTRRCAMPSLIVCHAVTRRFPMPSLVVVPCRYSSLCHDVTRRCAMTSLVSVPYLHSSLPYRHIICLATSSDFYFHRLMWSRHDCCTVYSYSVMTRHFVEVLQAGGVCRKRVTC